MIPSALLLALAHCTTRLLKRAAVSVCNLFLSDVGGGRGENPGPEADLNYRWLLK